MKIKRIKPDSIYKMTPTEIRNLWKSAEQMAKDIGVTKQSVYNWLRADSIPYLQLLRIEKALIKIQKDTNNDTTHFIKVHNNG